MTVRKPRQFHHAGFTLVEVQIAMLVIGLGILALLHAMASGSRINAAGRDITQATFLAQEIREWTLREPFSDQDEPDKDNPPGPDGMSPQVFVDDLDDLMNVTFSPPRDGRENPIAGLGDWSQVIQMDWRDPDDLDATVNPGASDVICVKVSIQRGNVEVLNTSWLVFRRDGE